MILSIGSAMASTIVSVIGLVTALAVALAIVLAIASSIAWAIAYVTVSHTNIGFRIQLNRQWRTQRDFLAGKILTP